MARPLSAGKSAPTNNRSSNRLTRVVHLVVAPVRKSMGRRSRRDQASLVCAIPRREGHKEYDDRSPKRHLTNDRVERYVGLRHGCQTGADTPVALLPAQVIIGFLAFGLIALLYLVTEELLFEAHEQPDSPLITAMFFVGFLALLMIEESLG